MLPKKYIVSLLGAFIVIKPDGNIIANVLSAQADSSRESLEVVAIADKTTSSQKGSVSIDKKDGKVNLIIANNQGEITTTDVTALQEDIVEIEEKTAAGRITIKSNQDTFVIAQQDIAAQTQFPITIDSEKKQISVETPSGERIVKVLPARAWEYVTKAHLVDSLTAESAISLNEDEEGELQYVIDGQKTISLLNLVEFNTPVTLSVSAISGEVLSTKQAVWLRVLGFLFNS